MKGQIVKIHSDLHYVQVEKDIYPCKCRGIFRKEKILPLVGDYVEFDPKKYVVEKILPRKNEFKRPKVSNIDQAFLITSLVSPDFSLNLLDKLLVLMELHSVQPIICITKKDLVKENDFDKTIEVLSYYQKIGYTVIYNTELNKIKKLLKDKTSVFTGQTGAGKSTLLNRLNPDWKLIENTDLKSVTQMKQDGYMDARLNVVYKDASNNEKPVSQIIVSEALANTPLEPGQSAGVELILTKTISSSVFNR